MLLRFVLASNKKIFLQIHSPIYSIMIPSPLEEDGVG
jgi:hypothetical protein